MLRYTVYSLLVVAAAAAAVGVLGAGGAPAGEPTAITLSQRLVADPALDFDDREGRVVGEPAIRARAAELLRDVPLPPGGGVDDIQWQNLGAASDAQIESLLQANASCDWYRHALGAGAKSGEALAIVQQIPLWSGIRARDLRGPAQRVADGLASGDTAPMHELAGGPCAGRRAGFPLPAALRGPQDGQV